MTLLPAPGRLLLPSSTTSAGVGGDWTSTSATMDFIDAGRRRYVDDSDDDGNEVFRVLDAGRRVVNSSAASESVSSFVSALAPSTALDQVAICNDLAGNWTATPDGGDAVESSLQMLLQICRYLNQGSGSGDLVGGSGDGGGGGDGAVFNLSSYAATAVGISEEAMTMDDADPTAAPPLRMFALVLGIFPILTLFGNVLVCLSVLTERSLHTVTNFFIVSLAVADIAVAVLVMPLAIYVEVGFYVEADLCIMLDLYRGGSMPKWICRGRCLCRGGSLYRRGSLHRGRSMPKWVYVEVDLFRRGSVSRWAYCKRRVYSMDLLDEIGFFVDADLHVETGKHVEIDLNVGMGLLVEVYQYFDVGLFVDEGQLDGSNRGGETTCRGLSILSCGPVC